MDVEHHNADVTAVRNVRCLACGTVYVAGHSGRSLGDKPGCPRCGYVGWRAEPRDTGARPEPDHVEDEEAS